MFKGYRPDTEGVKIRRSSGARGVAKTFSLPSDHKLCIQTPRDSEQTGKCC